MDMKLLEVLNGKLAERIGDITGFVANGRCTSFEHYKELVGRVQGLAAAQLEINDLVRNIKESDDE
jgi:hypothetical protein